MSGVTMSQPAILPPSCAAQIHNDGEQHQHPGLRLDETYLKFSKSLACNAFTNPVYSSNQLQSQLLVALQAAKRLAAKAQHCISVVSRSQGATPSCQSLGDSSLQGNTFHMPVTTPANEDGHTTTVWATPCSSWQAATPAFQCQSVYCTPCCHTNSSHADQAHNTTEDQPNSCGPSSYPCSCKQQPCHGHETGANGQPVLLPSSLPVSTPSNILPCCGKLPGKPLSITYIPTDQHHATLPDRQKTETPAAGQLENEPAGNQTETDSVQGPATAHGEVLQQQNSGELGCLSRHYCKWSHNESERRAALEAQHEEMMTQREKLYKLKVARLQAQLADQEARCAEQTARSEALEAALANAEQMLAVARTWASSPAEKQGR